MCVMYETMKKGGPVRATELVSLRIKTSADRTSPCSVTYNPIDRVLEFNFFSMKQQAATGLAPNAKVSSVHGASLELTRRVGWYLHCVRGALFVVAANAAVTASSATSSAAASTSSAPLSAAAASLGRSIVAAQVRKRCISARALDAPHRLQINDDCFCPSNRFSP